LPSREPRGRRRRPAGSGSARRARREFTEGAWLEPDLAHGAELYQTCAACHGPDGRGTEDGEIPAIAGQHGSVLLKQLTDFRHEQRWNERMQNFTDRHHLAGAQDLTDVAAYVASLRRFPPSAKGIGDGTDLSRRRERLLPQLRAMPRARSGQGDLSAHAAAACRTTLRIPAAPVAGDRGRHPAGNEPRARRHVEAALADQLRGVADYLSRVSPDLSSVRRK
jgi:cytochrome c553